ncbi:hypothetical protein [Ralstonia sp. SET104]|nr:hypothetical protein [Ralstonia sp. SET104]GCB02628.1 hypothetical protein PSUB009319_02590 [Ralstonia sp. SET104]
MNKPLVSVLLVILVEAIGAVVAYLKERLMHQMYPDGRAYDDSNAFA